VGKGGGEWKIMRIADCADCGRAEADKERVFVLDGMTVADALGRKVPFVGRALSADGKSDACTAVLPLTPALLAADIRSGLYTLVAADTVEIRANATNSAELAERFLAAIDAAGAAGAVGAAGGHFAMVQRGTILRIEGVAFAAGNNGGDAEVGTAIMVSAKEKLTLLLKRCGGMEVPVSITIDVDQGGNGKGQRSKGKAAYGLQLWAHTSSGCVLGGDSLGPLQREKGGKRGGKGGGGRGVKTLPLADAANVAMQAVSRLWEAIESGACVDEHTADQLVVFMAIASSMGTAASLSLSRVGMSSIIHCPAKRGDEHLETAIHTASLLTGAIFELGEVGVEVEIGGAGSTQRKCTCTAIRCRGANSI
jgi:hypothetical protein